MNFDPLCSRWTSLLVLACALLRLLPHTVSAASSINADDMFAHDRLIQIEVKLDPQDWHALRVSHRYEDETTRFQDKPYKYYRAHISIDGQEVVHPVAVRKKGFFAMATKSGWIVCNQQVTIGLSFILHHFPGLRA